MATFRYSAVVACVAIALACATPAGQSGATAPAPPSDVQNRLGVIDPVTPERDSVGPPPKGFEWTAIEGADHYELGLSNDLDGVVFSHNDVRGTTLAMPAEVSLMAGTYFWRVTAERAGRLVGDSGRSAFVVRE